MLICCEKKNTVSAEKTSRKVRIISRMNRVYENNMKIVTNWFFIMIKPSLIHIKYRVYDRLRYLTTKSIFYINLSTFLPLISSNPLLYIQHISWRDMSMFYVVLPILEHFRRASSPLWVYQAKNERLICLVDLCWSASSLEPSFHCVFRLCTASDDLAVWCRNKRQTHSMYPLCMTRWT
jgi:hypothetical protein